MSIDPGQTLLHYRLIEKIGEGGMGQVWKAVDTTLDRQVAIKILPATFAGDAGRLARFEREAKLLASLSHPNIAAIHSVHQHQDLRFLTMELVEGEDLAQRLQRGPIPAEEALDVARQIAVALEAAHESGVIHRDLKPANVKLTPDAQVKVLDFGLAKALAPDPAGGGADPASSPTMTSAGTLVGEILGTAAYMSPEQARGRAADRRADIWAFGCVLYECLTGRSPFRGPTVSDSLGAILHKEPDWDALPEGARSVRRLLERCLRKNATERLQHIGDARIEIAEALAGREVSSGERDRRFGVPSWKLAVPWGLAALLALAFLLVLPSLRQPSPAGGAVKRLLIETVPLDVAGRGPAVALSRDGRRLAYVGQLEGVTHVFVRDLDSFEARQLPGTRDARGPFFSPDGERLGFISGSELRTESVAGGPVAALFRGWEFWGAAWGRQDRIVFGEWPSRRLMSVSARGDEVRSVTERDLRNEDYVHAQPEFIGDSGAILYNSFNAFTGVGAPSVMAMDSRGDKKQLVAEGGTNPRYAPTGHLVFATNGSLMAAPFDLDSFTLTAPPVPVLQGVMTSGNVTAQYAIADDGTLAYVPGKLRTVEHTLVQVDRTGAAVPMTDARRAFWGPRFSPDGGRLAFWLSGDDPQVWVLEIARGSLTRLTSQRSNFWPVWTPDGDRVVFPSRDVGLVNLFWQGSDGSEPMERLTDSEFSHQPGAWSPDGKWLVFQQSYDPRTGFDIWIFDLEKRLARPLMETEANEYQPSLSADGEWLAYVSDESGRREVYVTRFPDQTSRTAISVDGGSEPVWNPRGGELFFRNNDRLMVADFFDRPDVKPSRPRVLFEGRFVPGTPYGRNYDISPDGKRFVMIQSAERETAPSEIHVVLNWFQELERLVPTK